MSYCFSDTCKVPDEFDRIIPDCNEFYSLSEEETKDFGVEWSNKEERNLTSNDKTTDEQSLSAWHYKKDDSFLYMGQISSYRGGGYIIELGPDEAKASEKLGSVKDHGWVDRYTRALFTELSLYNVNVNLLGVVSLLFEDLPTGNGQLFVNIQTIRVFRYLEKFSSALLACEVILAFMLVRWIVRDGKRLWKERKAFWRNLWNIIDLAITALSIASLILYFMRLAFLKFAIKKFRKDRSKFVSFQYVVLLNEGVKISLALAVLLLNLKFLRLLRFNRKISVLSSSIKASARKLVSFMVMFLVIFLAYCFLVLLVFGAVLKDYRSIVRCMVSMMAMILGNFEYYDLVEVHPIIGPAVFFSFMVIFQFVIMNMFIGILCDSFEEVRADAVKQCNEYEILEFMTNRVKAFLGLFVEPPIRPEYNWPKSGFEKTVETINEKAEATMFFMRNLCAEDTREMKWFEPDKWSSKKSKVLSLVLQSEVEIVENDLYDGTVAMSAIIEKYSENELDRMRLANRMRRSSSVMLKSGSCDNYYADSESDDPSTDNDISESINNATEHGAERNMADEIKADRKDEDLTDDDTRDNEEEIGELMQEIEEEFGVDDQDGEDDVMEEVKEKEERFTESASRKNNSPLQQGTILTVPQCRSSNTVSFSGAALAVSASLRERAWQGSREDLGENSAGHAAENSERDLGYATTPSTPSPFTAVLAPKKSLNSVEAPLMILGGFGDPGTIFKRDADHNKFARHTSGSKE